MTNYCCHCDVRANDGKQHLTSKPTVYSEGKTRVEAHKNAVKQLEEKYKKLGCVWVDVQVVLMREI